MQKEEMRHTFNIGRMLGVMLIIVPFLMSSCWEKEEAKAPEGYSYITGATLGAVRRLIHVTDTAGRDSLYYTSYSGNMFPMIIDQRNLTIENRDSLLTNSIVAQVLVNITYDGAYLGYRPASDSTAEWTAYNSSDSLDLREPIHLLVVSQDGLNKRIYTMKVNVHQQEGDSICWNRVDSTETIFQNMSELRAEMLNGELLVIGRSSTGLQAAKRDGLSGSGKWEIQSTNLPSDALVETLMEYAGSMFMTCADGSVWKTQDGTNWSQLSAAKDGLTLAAVTDSFYYALINGSLFRSQNANEWTEEQLDDNVDLLPSTPLQSLFYSQTNGNRRILLCGPENESNCVVWSKMWENDTQEKNAQWLYYPHAADNPYPCPHLKNLTLLPYDGKIIALGGAGKGYKALEHIYVSSDNGINWRADAGIHLPSELLGAEGPIAAAVDKNNFIWIIANSQVWRGRLNRLGFARQ